MKHGMNIVFAGTPDFATVPLASLLDARYTISAVLTQPDRPAGRGRKPQPSPVKLLANQHGLPVYQPETLKDPDIQQTLRALAPDLMVVVAYGLILPATVLEIPRFGCINILDSLLPRWRGAAPIQRALLAGDAGTGVTIIQMDRGLDTGAMLQRDECPITPGETTGSLHDKLAAIGARALVDVIGRIVDGTISGVPQDEAQACYAAKIDKAAAELDWSRPAVELERQVRAFNPWPVAYTVLPPHGRLRVWRAHVLATESAVDNGPGVMVHAGREGIDVSTGAGILRLTEIQLAGGRPMPAGDFINAHAVPVGAVLGGEVQTD
ncbi:MAG: methionyl-tRNA formyltransferase [Gammaproteobacteria bacterium]|nr:methionyl-tRNA formyltransferase [Gammaproteobacteria bacterium]